MAKRNQLFYNLNRLFIPQHWFGKLLGALLGYLVAGPVGAVVGILAGNLVDRSFYKKYSNYQWIYNNEKQKSTQNYFFYATFLFLGYVCKADGRISEKEIEMARSIMQKMSLNKVQKKLAQHYFNAGKNEKFDLDKTLQILFNFCKNNKILLKLFIDIQYQGAKIDGLNQQKINILNNLLIQLKFAPLNQQHPFYWEVNDVEFNNERYKKNQYANTKVPPHFSSFSTNMLDDPYFVLDISRTSSTKDIKRAYRKLMAENHPDKLIAKRCFNGIDSLSYRKNTTYSKSIS